MQAELDAIGNRGVVVEQKYAQWTGIGVAEIHVSENIEGLRGDFPGIRRQPVRDFQTVLIGLVFEVSGEGVQDRPGNGGD